MKTRRGNALFLILIAVALFAALSYAVTQSGRGGGTADKEKAVIDAAKTVQQYAAIRTAIQRMTLTGTAAASLEFCSSGAGACIINSADDYCASGSACIFAAEGGGATPPVVDFNLAWIYWDTLLGIDEIGVTGVADPLIATEIPSQSMCEQINKGLLGATTIPACVGGPANCGRFFNQLAGNIDTAKCATCVGTPALCFDLASAGSYYYYQVMVEQ